MDCNDKGMQLLEDFWKWRLNNSPEFATFCGIHDFDDKLESYTLDDIIERKVLWLSLCLHFLFVKEVGYKE